MRLFTGLPIPQPARTAVADILQDLVGRNWPVRWVRPEGLHLTLKFFGSVEESRIASIEAALDRASQGFGPIALNCSVLGTFPAGRRAKVIWLGIEAPAALELLQDAIERACLPLGFPVEGRPFHPHITLGRVSAGQRLPPGTGLPTGPDYDIPFLAERLVLFESRGGTGGARYAERHLIPLSPCAAA